VSLTRSLCTLAAVACALGALSVGAPAHAQSVSGKVTDATTGVPIADVRVTLLRGDGTRVADAITDRLGAFQFATWNPGTHRLEASHVAYMTTSSDTFEVGIREEVVVVLRIAAAAIPLEPLAITARRRDYRDDATHEGFYARQLLAAGTGANRVITRVDDEMVNARDARDVLVWLPGARERPRVFGREGQCLVVYWNGNLMGDVETAEMWLDTPAHMLEGLEFYRTLTEAPMDFRQVPPYLYDCARHTVVALWQRTGYFGPDPVDLSPSTRRLSVATGAYHLTGDRAPGIGAGVEVTAHWPLARNVALGLGVRRTAHQLSAATTSSSISPILAPFYATPPGERGLALWTGSAESRLTLPRTGGVWPVVAARVQVARRAFSLRSSSADGTMVPVTSDGIGGGITVGAETVVNGRFALHAALGHDRIFFGPYSNIEHRTNPTRAQWGATSLRIGAGYALQR
jgi:hypothetical protein